MKIYFTQPLLLRPLFSGIIVGGICALLFAYLKSINADSPDPGLFDIMLISLPLICIIFGGWVTWKLGKIANKSLVSGTITRQELIGMNYADIIRRLEQNLGEGD